MFIYLLLWSLSECDISAELRYVTRARSRMKSWAAGGAKCPQRQQTLGSAAHEASVDTERQSRGLSGRTALKPPRSPNEAAKLLRRAQGGADVARVRARSLQHSPSSLRSAHLLLCRTLNI